MGHFPKCKGLKKFLQTTDWQHPDIANQEMPSSNISIRTRVDALSQKTTSLFEMGSSEYGLALMVPRSRVGVRGTPSPL